MKKEGLNFSIITLILVVILVALLGFVAGWYLGTVSPNSTSQATPTPTAISSTSAKATATASADWHKYTDSTYGFTVTVNDKYNGYRILGSTDSAGTGVINQAKYDVYAPISADAIPNDVNKPTYYVDALNGYYQKVTEILIYTPDKWAEQEKAPVSPMTYMTQNNKYVFVWAPPAGSGSFLPINNSSDINYIKDNFQAFNL